MGLIGSASKNSNKEEKNELPLLVKWKRGKGTEWASKVVESRLSMSEEWIIIDTEDFRALLNKNSDVGEVVWEFLLQLDGKLKCLMVVHASGKLGFDIEPGEDEGFWIWEDDVVRFTKKKSKSCGSMQSLTLKAMESTGTGNASTPAKIRSKKNELPLTQETSMDTNPGLDGYMPHTPTMEVAEH